jgi:hypothetical protein
VRSLTARSLGAIVLALPGLFTQAEFDLSGNSNYASPGATLSGGTFPYVDERVEPVTFALPFSFRVRLNQENEWFVDDAGSFAPYFKTRHRLHSVDTP